LGLRGRVVFSRSGAKSFSDMLQEFAIDPTMLGGWEQYSRVVQDCGVEHGRLISDFPNRWRKMCGRHSSPIRVAQLVNLN